jgi:3-phenylpropionate/trans-cinnamate dioxygenase ferredoxin component
MSWALGTTDPLTLVRGFGTTMSLMRAAATHSLESA